MSEVSGKRVLITGAAAGMGALMAERFAQEGAALVLVDVNDAALQASAARLAQAGRTVQAFAADLAKPAEIRSLQQRVAKACGPIDILVNNAGVVTGGLFEEIPEEKDQRMLDVNVAAVHWMTKAFLPDMKKRGEGHIVNLGSAAGFIGVPRQVVYCATKWFVIGFSEALRLELEQQGYARIHVTVACPSYVDTGMFAGVKAPLLTPLLKPGFVAGAIVQAVKDNALFVKEPFIVKTTPVLKALLPIKLFDRVADRLGVTRSMESWVGR